MAHDFGLDEINSDYLSYNLVVNEFLYPRNWSLSLPYLLDMTINKIENQSGVYAPPCGGFGTKGTQ